MELFFCRVTLFLLRISSHHPIHSKRELMFRSACCINSSIQTLVFKLFLRLLITPNRFDHAATDHPPSKES